MSSCKRSFPGRKKRRKILTLAYWQNEEMMDAIVEEAARLDWDMMDIRFFGPMPPPDYKPDGILVCRSVADQRLRLLKTLSAPILTVGFWEAGQEAGFPLVTEDEEKIGQLAADHFLERGFGQIGYVSAESDFEHPHNRRLYQSFKNRLDEAGRNCLAPLLLPSLEPESDARLKLEFASWLKKTTGPVGLLVYRDILAGNVCGMCRLSGVSVPEQVAILGIGNRRQFCKLSPIPLSSVDPDSAAQGREAVRQLQRMMDGETVKPGLIRIPPAGVVARGSTDMLAAGDPVVVRALRLMWDNLDQDMSVDDVAGMVQCPRHKLERAFRRHLGRGIIAELRRRRTQELARLLRESDLPIADLGPKVGFRTMKHLHRSFRQAYGLSPRTYRQMHSQPEPAKSR
jgi:LacI family transcriptional regulator